MLTAKRAKQGSGPKHAKAHTHSMVNDLSALDSFRTWTQLFGIVSNLEFLTGNVEATGTQLTVCPLAKPVHAARPLQKSGHSILTSGK